MTAVTEDIRVATFSLGQSGGVPTVEPYQAGAIYSIDDLNPWLFIGFIEGNKSLFVEKQRVGKLERHPDGPADGLTWWRWQPLAEDNRQIGSLRRYGHYRTELHQPRRITLQCYVWPKRFCDAGQYQMMLAEIEQEFGRPIEWERSDVSIRSRVVVRRGMASDAELLLTIRGEVRAAHMLEQSSALAESAVEAYELAEAAASPEARLVAMWAWRRLADLVQMRRRQADVEHVHRANATDSNQKRSRRHNERTAVARADEREADRLAAQVSRIADRRRRDLSSFDLSPAMQRDHRLRRLVRAFAPATREHWAATPTLQMSTSPPLKAPDVFEMWSIARMVRAIIATGWTVRRRVTSRATVAPAAEPYLVELSKEDFVLTLEHNPTIHRIDCSSAPSMHERRVPLLAWASANVPGPDGLVATSDLTPDYALRLSSVAGAPLALALGDATLSDPKYVTEIEDNSEGNKTKADKLITYRERIGWRAGGRLIRCPPACTFIILPGPSSRWEGTANHPGVDSVLIFPDPSAADDIEVTARVRALVETMLSAAGAAR